MRIIIIICIRAIQELVLLLVVEVCILRIHHTTPITKS